MVELLGLGAHRLIGDEPDIARAPAVSLMAPARDVTLVLKRHTHGKAVDRNGAGLREMEEALVVMVQESGGC